MGRHSFRDEVEVCKIELLYNISLIVGHLPRNIMNPAHPYQKANKVMLSSPYFSTNED